MTNYTRVFRLVKTLFFELNMINACMPRLPTFEEWAKDFRNESQKHVFLSVCRIINPIIPDICRKFGYPGYLQIVKSLIAFFGDSYLSDDEVQELSEIFPVLHDAGIAALSVMNFASIHLWEGLANISSATYVNACFLNRVFNVCPSPTEIKW